MKKKGLRRQPLRRMEPDGVPGACFLPREWPEALRRPRLPARYGEFFSWRRCTGWALLSTSGFYDLGAELPRYIWVRYRADSVARSPEISVLLLRRPRWSHQPALMSLGPRPHLARAAESRPVMTRPACQCGGNLLPGVHRSKKNRGRFWVVFVPEPNVLRYECGVLGGLTWSRLPSPRSGRRRI